MAGPLEGITAVEVSQGLAGAYLGMLLADFGARVVRVDPPGAKDAPVFRMFHRGKQRVALDLATPLGRRALEALARGADVLLHDLSPSRARALGLTYEALGPHNPRLVFCSLPPLGEDGPRASWGADDFTVGALSGIYAGQGGPGGDPVHVRLPLPSYGAALLAASAVTSALLAREATGMGQRVEVPLLAGAMALQTGDAVLPRDLPPRARGPREPYGLWPVYRLYQGSDGGWFFLACGNTFFWNKFCLAMELTQLLEDPDFADAPWGIPPGPARRLASHLEERFRQRPASYWLEFLEGHDIPVAPVMDREGFLRHPQAVHLRAFCRREDPVLGPTTQVGVLVDLERSPGRAGPPSALPGPGREAGPSPTPEG